MREAQVAKFLGVSYLDELRALADSFGIATHYWAHSGEHVTVSEETLQKTLKSFGVEIDDTVESIHRAWQRRADEEFSRPLPPCVVTTGETSVNVHVHDGAPAYVWITLEDGGVVTPNQAENWAPARTINGVTWGEATFVIPSLPTGWHTLHLESDGIRTSCALIVCPERLSTNDRFVEHPVLGVMAQMYSVRSNDSWGIGDFRDLGELAATLTPEADYLLINPLHAAEPVPPVEDSPYLPTSRRFVNPIYLRVEDVAEFKELAEQDPKHPLVIKVAELANALQANPDEFIDRNPIYAAKLAALYEIFQLGRSPERQVAFAEYRALEGAGLARFAAWCAQYTGAHADPDAEYFVTEPSFYEWLQWQCDEQLAQAQARAKDAGMAIGIMADLAVGVHPGGADAANLADVLVAGASVGAPPDNYNQLGQDWSQPPWHPVRLAEAGYAPWRDMLRTVLRHSGGIRIDHILGLFRLWWIPRSQSPLTGTYVYYDHQALLGILALEAERAGAVVIGEDLGTMEPWVVDELRNRGIMGTSIVWFENTYDGPRHAGDYRQLALSSVTTHDLPPTAGYLFGEHIALRDRLGLFERSVADEDAEDLQWQNQVLDRVAEYGFLPGTFAGKARNDRGEVTDLLVGLHRYLSATPSALTCISLVDMVGDIRPQNQPGTMKEQYPNWCIPLRTLEGEYITIENLRSYPLFNTLLEASKRQG